MQPMFDLKRHPNICNHYSSAYLLRFHCFDKTNENAQQISVAEALCIFYQAGEVQVADARTQAGNATVGQAGAGE